MHQISLVEQEMLTFPEHLGSLPVFSKVLLLIVSFMCSDLWIIICSFVLFLFAIVLSVFFIFVIVLSFLLFTASDYPFGILKRFLDE
jgi:hypothetical protein